MTALKVARAATGLALLALMAGSCAVQNRQPAHMVVGTMVVTDAPARRFRIAGHDEVFTAPRNTPLHALDGRYVFVQVTSRGKVEQISDQGPSSE
jgi:hypothetical protein